MNIFTISKTWMHARCRRNKIWHITTMEYSCCLVAQSCPTLLGLHRSWPDRFLCHAMGFPRQEYWGGLPLPSPEGLPDPGIQPVSPSLAGRFFPTVPLGKLYDGILFSLKKENYMCATTWMNLKDIILNEISQSQEGILYDPLIWGS